jgi:hypothetical protein
MTLPHDVSLVLRSQIARATTLATPTEPVRLLARRRVPLTRDREQLGHLEVLLRLSCRGEGEGDGVLVFEWPSGASEHSVVRMLESWSERCGEAGTCHYRGLELERKDKRSGEAPGVHLKVKFPLSEIPNTLFELLDLAARVGFAEAVRAEIDLSQKKPVGEEEQAKIDKIEHNAVFDAKIHPHVNPNEEVTASDGKVFRLVMKRVGSVRTRTWIHVQRGRPTESLHINARKAAGGS